MITTTVNHLFGEIVDYAGLFPPASLPLASVIKSYDEYRQSPQRWMLGRLVLPHGLLEEFEQRAERRLRRADDAQAWKISCLVPPPDSPDWAPILRKIVRFNERHSTAEDARVRIDMIETKADHPDQLVSLSDFVDRRIDVYVEFPYREDPASLIETLVAFGNHRLRGKIRTGGVESELIPSVSDVHRFFQACITAGLPFKATAGLHHPTRNAYPLTYSPQTECAVMHGFLNVLMAAGLIMQARASRMEVAQVLGETDASQFRVNDNGFSWRDWTLTPPELQQLRAQGLVSFGSCSFVEPVEELEVLGVPLD